MNIRAPLKMGYHYIQYAGYGVKKGKGAGPEIKGGGKRPLTISY